MDFLLRSPVRQPVAERPQQHVIVPVTVVPGTVNYLAPIASVLPSYAHAPSISNFESLALIDPKLKNGYAESTLWGPQQSLGGNLRCVTASSALNQLVTWLTTNDIVNCQSPPP